VSVTPGGSGPAVPEPLGAEVLARVFSALAADSAGFVDGLAARLAAALPGRTRVDHGGLLGRGPVRRIAVDLGDQRFELHHDRGRLETRVATAVRGVVIRTEDVPVDGWLAGLARALSAEADASQAVRAALETAFL